jgi:hypothetical protein
VGGDQIHAAHCTRFGQRGERGGLLFRWCFFTGTLYQA